MDARLIIDLFFAHLLFEILLHHAEGVRVAVSQWVAKDGVVLADIHEVASPSVDADALDVDTALGDELQALDDLEIKGINVPIEVAARLDEVVVETRQLLQVKLAAGQAADDGSSASGTQIHGEEIFAFCHTVLKFLSRYLFYDGKIR